MPTLYKPRVSRVDIEDIELQLASDIPAETIEELYRFGEIMVSEVQRRCGSLDQKLTSMLGWSAAVLALLLTNGGELSKLNGAWRAVLFIATLIALGAMFSAAWGIKSKIGPTPSEQDWFMGELEAPDRMKKYHIISMLNIHQSQSQANLQKAASLHHSEILLIISGLAIASALFYLWL